MEGTILCLDEGKGSEEDALWLALTERDRPDRLVR